MGKIHYILSVLLVILGCAAAVLWLRLDSGIYHIDTHVYKYGVSEGMELVCRCDDNGQCTYWVEDNVRHTSFALPLSNCLVDTKYREGKLQFIDPLQDRKGYIDHQGRVIYQEKKADDPLPEDLHKGQAAIDPARQAPDFRRESAAYTGRKTIRLSQTDLKQMPHNHPFFQEATKILSNKLDVEDKERRRVILNYCENFRTSYTTKDIDFLRQVFSNNALIIVGNVVNNKATSDEISAGDEKVSYSLRSKEEYLARLEKTFAANKSIDVKFSDFHIRRHPTMDGIYGVTLRQYYQSDCYRDEGYLFLLWDFRDPSMPLIHVRTWQPLSTLREDDDIISISDFNLR